MGDVAADVVEDLHGKELRDTLTERELTEYQKQDKVTPQRNRSRKNIYENKRGEVTF